MKKQYTPQEVIRWLKRNYKPSAKFSYFNGFKQVCLFSRFLRNATRNKDLLVCNNGSVKHSDRWGDYATNVIPFHNEFWGTANRTINRDKAIKKLQSLIK